MYLTVGKIHGYQNSKSHKNQRKNRYYKIKQKKSIIIINIRTFIMFKPNLRIFNNIKPDLKQYKTYLYPVPVVAIFTESDHISVWITFNNTKFFKILKNRFKIHHQTTTY